MEPSRGRTNFPRRIVSQGHTGNWRNIGSRENSEDGLSHLQDGRHSGSHFGGPNQRRGGAFRCTGRTEHQESSRRRQPNRNEPFGRSMGFMFFEKLLHNDAEGIILRLMNETKGFSQLLETELTSDTIVLIVKILRKVCSSSFGDTKYTVLQCYLNEKFINKLQTFIACLPSQSALQRRSSWHFWRDPNEFWTNLIEICEDILRTIPTFGCKCLPVVLNSLKIYIPIIEQEQQIQVADEVKVKVGKMLEVIKILAKEKEESANRQSSKQELEPPDDFRQIDVYPSAEEIVSGRGFLRENIVKGPYQNVNHYLDVQYRLLREDFVGPLREGIANYRSSAPSDRIENVKVHKGVRFLNSETINEYYCVRVQFKSGKKKPSNYENSRRFMYGSLLCFTRDDFKTLIFGKVAQRKLEDLAKGELIVAFDEKKEIPQNTDFLMVECNVYFEPYFHVLTVLKTMTEENFPMERYIIRVNSTVQPPEYLATPDCLYEIEEEEFDPMSEWPHDNFYNFNESQLVAFKAAITQEIVVIQGPPGTGKTYLGLKVAQTLLENKEFWYERTPMLVICFTNHALDQFLEGLIPFTHDIIRVGGQSKNPNMDSYNLRNKTARDEAVARQRLEVQRCLGEIKLTTEILEQIDFYNSVLSFDVFKEVVPHFVDTWFDEATKKEIIDWLLQGGEYQQNFNRPNSMNLIQVQQEFGNIDISDDVNDTPIIADDRSLILFDNLFDEVINKSVNSRSSFSLITLKSMRDELRQLEDYLAQLMQVQSPTFEQLIQEENLNLQLFKLRQKFEYLKTQLAEGRQKRDTLEKPKRFNLIDPFSMSFEDRWNLYFYWLNLYRNHMVDELQENSENFSKIYKVYEEMREMEDVRVMKNALVVGMTTTSAARLRSSLQTLKNPIVIVEEAAEVLEAHIVTSITKHCKHLILIGDHKQLKPNTASYSIDKHYRLGISLFERMLINNIHCYTLNVQHRMRPEISCLIRPTIYSFLEDHPSVHHRPPITGIDNCIFFIDHNNPEESDDSFSKTNYHEVSFFIYLARHLVLNGYNPENITILAAYLGQFFAFLKERKKHSDLLQTVRIAVLDNYQGEESDIILLSLVRNNDENKIGFLSIENRVCVALSRARNGLYIMGNMSQLCHDNKLWRKIKKSLEAQNALGAELSLRCQIHHDQVTAVKCDRDFLAISEGGCSKKCEASLSCGHECASLCHIRDRSHMYYKCQFQCNKNLCDRDESHICKKMCYEECGLCSYLVQRTLPCGHEVNIECHIDPETYKCQISVSTKLPCGHVTDKPCFCDPVTFRCPHICDVKVEPCGHACELSCHIRRDPDHLEYKCNKPCAKFRKNCTVKEDDHRCPKKCYEECDECTIVVRKHRTICPHLYDVPCTSDVDEIDCEKPCAKILPCGHKCVNKCNQPCGTCQLKVTKINPICNHPIKVKCCENPDRKLCNKKCPLKLPCGHPCTARCNEPCTAKCLVLVDCDGVEAECGHKVTRTECNMANSGVDPKLLLAYCKEPCRMELKCGHLCSGSCGGCAQGRMHKRCTAKCGAVLVCDHQCEIPCRQECRPCKRICSYKCIHSSCRKTCGEVCTPCKEPCPRRCIHQKCNKFCGDICSVPPCTQPCQKSLDCGHACVGFCGDPCPPKCLICDKDELLEIFFGTESEDARYVFLNDCQHIVEYTGMEEWLQQNEYQISYKVCPICKTAIKTTQRYSDYIKRAVKDVAQVKLRTSGKFEEIEKNRKEILSAIRHLNLRVLKTFRLMTYCPLIKNLLLTMHSRLQLSRKGKRQPINIYELHSMKSKLQIIENIFEICCHEEVILESPKEIFFPQLNFIFTALSRDTDYITDQEIEDINSEISRLSRIVEFSRIQKSSEYSYKLKNDATVKRLSVDIEKRAFLCKQYTKEDNDVLKNLLKELNSSVCSGIAISESVRREILRAMGFSKGHWFKCPNGHIYAIGECGGAMQESVCNECGAKIGGRSHQLRADNAVATEMDGAVRDAYTESANMFNNYMRRANLNF